MQTFRETEFFSKAIIRVIGVDSFFFKLSARPPRPSHSEIAILCSSTEESFPFAMKIGDEVVELPIDGSQAIAESLDDGGPLDVVELPIDGSQAIAESLEVEGPLDVVELASNLDTAAAAAAAGTIVPSSSLVGPSRLGSMIALITLLYAKGGGVSLAISLTVRHSLISPDLSFEHKLESWASLS